MKKISLLLMLLVLVANSYAQKGKDAALEAIGGTTGMLLYNTYMVIGMAADGFASELYDAERAAEIVGEQLGSTATVQEQLEALIKSGFLTDPSDAAYLRRIVGAFEKVSLEGEALLRYLENRKDEDAATYDEYRNQAWSEISSLLGLEASEVDED